MDAFNQLLVVWAEALRLMLESLSVLTVLLGVLVSVRQALRLPALGSMRLGSVRVGTVRVETVRLGTVRLELGRWLSMALEFQLAADIVATTISPTGQQLIQLAAIALIRTFLNLALSREARAEQSPTASTP